MLASGTEADVVSMAGVMKTQFAESAQEGVEVKARKSIKKFHAENMA